MKIRKIGKIGKLLLFLLVSACLACVVAAFSACGKKDGGDSYGYGEEGYYYYDASDSSRYMLSLQSGEYMITVNDSTAYSGTYSYDEESGTLSFSGDEKFTAAMGDSALSLVMEDSGYSFKAYVFFDVTYVDETGNVVAAGSVLNGQTAEEISGDGLKDGYWFVGWYTDAANSSAYAFDVSVAGDTTIYGWFVEKVSGSAEHTVTLDYGDGFTETWMTMNGTIYKELPAEHDGESILGWWVSATNKSDELTFRYEAGEVFDADTTLFAVYSGIGSSVTSEGITWSTSGVGSNVTITVTDENGVEKLGQTVSSSSGRYTSSEFSSLGTGTYTVEISSGNVSEKRVYVVNGLARVSLSSDNIVVSGSEKVISFAPVEGADGYTITVTNGVASATVDLGNQTFYNFSGFEMTKEGITFVVTAYAEGYASSVSDAFTYFLALEKVTVSINEDVVSWTAAEGTAEYVVTLTDADGNVIDTFTTTETSFSLKYYDAGTYDITVLPRADGYYSEGSVYRGYAKTSLASPVVTNVTAKEVTWSAVTGAVSYIVLINGTEYPVQSGTTLVFSDSSVPNGDSYEISVKAVGTNDNDSPYGDSVTIGNLTFTTSVSYAGGTVTWDYDLSATSYGVSVNSGTETVVFGNSAAVILTQSGENVIRVTAYNGAETVAYADVTVFAYAVTLDPNGAVLNNDRAVNGVLYVAQGDAMNLGTVTKDHASFVGWYTQPDYTDGQSDVYQGSGSLVSDGAIFSGSGSMYLYAYWTYEYVTVTLHAGNGTFSDGTTQQTVQIKYNSTTYDLPEVTATLPTDDFAGWYSGQNGTGELYENGVAYKGDTVLYAYFLDVFSYSRTRYNGEVVYSVSAGSQIDSVTSVTVPETYNGYKLVINSNAFYGCSNLVTINIPDTVVYIAVVSNGNRLGSGAFTHCTSLEAVNVYATELNSEPVYFSDQGVLFHKITGTEDVELLYFPQGKSLETYTMPSYVSIESDTDYNDEIVGHAVTTIPSQVFRDKQIENIVIASSVTTVASQAFYANTNLKTVTFAEGGSEDLTIYDGAFVDCSSLTTVTLPARYSNFNASAFEGCTVLAKMDIEVGGTHYSSEDGVLLSADGTTLVYFPTAHTAGEVDIGNIGSSTNITKIEDEAFIYNTKITSVVIPATVTYIGVSAFEGCTKLSSVTFGDASNVTQGFTIKTRAFYGCTLLSSVTLPVNLTVLEENAFGGCLNLTTVTYEARNGTVSTDLNFADGAFGTTNYITTLNLGANVPMIDFANIFDGGKLTMVTIADGSQSYYADEYGAVYDAQKSTILYYPRGRSGGYTLEASTQTIVSGAFSGRYNLTSVTIGKNVNTIEAGSFEGCTYLVAIYVDAENSNFGNGTDGGDQRDGILYAKDADTESLAELIYCPLMTAMTEITVPDTVVKVATEAFSKNQSVESVTFTATTLFEFETDDEGDSYTFYDCKSLASVVLPDCMTEIPGYAFYNCESLSSANIPSSVKSIGEYAFWTCSALTGDLTSESAVGENTSIELPEGLVSVGTYAFYNDKNLAVTIPSTVEAIGNYAFGYCWYNEVASAEIVFASVNSESGISADSAEDGGDDSYTAGKLVIGDGAFSYTYRATGVTIPANTVSIGSNGFSYMGYNVTSGTAVTFEEECELTELPDFVFQYNKYLAEVTLPENLVNMGQRAFYNCSSLATVNFAPEGKTSQLSEIGAYAFTSSKLTAVTIPASVMTIGSSAFGSITTITSITFEDGSVLETIRDSAFKAVSITEIAIPASVTTIENNVFEACTSLAKVSFQGEGETSALTQIGYYCFSGCTALEDVELPAALEETGNGTMKGIFYGCTSLKEISIPSTVKTITERTFNGCSSLATVTFEVDPGTQKCSLELIDNNAFMNCTSLTSFTFPESTSVIKLGGQIFYNTYVSVVTLSSSVRSIGTTFIGQNMTKIEVCENHPVYAVDDSGQMLYTVDGGTIAYVCPRITSETLEIPETITAIGESAFAIQQSIKKVVIPASVTEIGDYAFYYCTSLEEVEFADDSGLITGTMGGHVFEGCSALKKVNIPSTVTAIPDYFFYGCNMTETDFDGITVIGDYALYGTAVTELDLSGVTTVGKYGLGGMKQLVSVTFGEGLLSIGNYALSDSSVTEVTIPGRDTDLGVGLFYGCTSLEEADISAVDTTEVGSSMFCGCTSLTSVKLPETALTLDSNAFYNCTALETVIIPDAVTDIGTSCFYGCSSLSDISLPASLKSIEKEAFYKCTSLVSCDLPSSLTEIGEKSFYGCTALVDIIFPEALTSIGENAFEGCTALETVLMNDGLESIGAYCFQNCTSLQSVTIGKGLTTVSAFAFSGCTALEYAYTGDMVDTVGSSAFVNCSMLKTVEFGPVLRIIEPNAFKNCSSLTTISFGKVLDQIGQEAFSGCTALTGVVIPSSVTLIGSSAFAYCTCDIFVENTENYASTNWVTEMSIGTVTVTIIWNSDFNGDIYYYSQSEPDLNSDETDYDGSYWYYDDGDVATPWVFA